MLTITLAKVVGRAFGGMRNSTFNTRRGEEVSAKDGVLTVSVRAGGDEGRKDS